MQALLARTTRVWSAEVDPEERDVDDDSVLRLGLVGASNISTYAVVYPASKSRQVMAYAVASRDASKAQAFADKHKIPVVHDSVQELLADVKVDAVYISVPTELHLEFGLMAIEAGKHVLLEKPLALSASDARKLRDAAQAKGVVLMEAMHYRHHPVAKRAREIVASGELGEIESLDATFAMFDRHSYGLGGSWDERKRETKMLDRYIYCLDIVRLLSQAEPTEVVRADHEAFFVKADLVLGTADASARRIEAHICTDSQSIRLLPKWQVKVEGTKGSLVWDNFNVPSIYHLLTVTPKAGDADATAAPARTEQHYAEGETTFEFQLQAFVRVVRGQGAEDLDLTRPLPQNPGPFDDASVVAVHWNETRVHIVDVPLTQEALLANRERPELRPALLFAGPRRTEPQRSAGAARELSFEGATHPVAARGPKARGHAWGRQQREEEEVPSSFGPSPSSVRRSVSAPNSPMPGDGFELLNTDFLGGEASARVAQTPRESTNGVWAPSTMFAAPAPARRGMRTRALSECGRQLLADVYHGGGALSPRLMSPLAAGATAASMQAQMPPIALGAAALNTTASTTLVSDTQGERRSSASAVAAAKNLQRRQSKQQDVARNGAGGNNNYFASMMSDDEEDVGAHVFAQQPSSPRLQAVRNASVEVPVISKATIEESVIGEDEAEMDTWETVPVKKSVRKKKKKPPAQEVPAPQPQPPPPGADEFFSDEDDLFDLQIGTFVGRQVGSARKAMQHKARERRDYAIDKRNRQR
ncbi:D-xylose 1-dehydrogenase (NADP(+)) 2 (XDH 2), partial [Durusdinium trenchii]